MAEVAARSRRDARDNEYAQVMGDFDVDELLADSYLSSPLRKHDCAPISDGAAAIVLAAGDAVKKCTTKPAWIRGMDHRVGAASAGLPRSDHVELDCRCGARRRGVSAGKVDVAELYAPYSHQEIILREVVGLGRGHKNQPVGRSPLRACVHGRGADSHR